MMHLGSPDDWMDFLDPIIPDIVHLIADTWPTSPTPAGDEMEDAITNSFCRTLRASRTARLLPFQVHTQYVELDGAEGEKQGRIDIVFSPFVPREDIYFALECKRLNVREPRGTIRPYHAEYVHDGMTRFISGQYSVAGHAGGMLGYVLDGEVGHAMAGVEANISQHYKGLGMASPGKFQPSQVRPNDSCARETRHRRPTSSSDFAIHHLFVACDPTTPLRAKPVSSGSRTKRSRKRKRPNS
jgi:hypothetical protein